MLIWQEENDRPCIISSAFSWGWAVFHIYYAHSLLFLNFYFFNLLYGHATSHARCEFTNQGLKLRPLQWKNKVLTTGPPRKSPAHSLKECLSSTKQIPGTEYIKMNKTLSQSWRSSLFSQFCLFTVFKIFYWRIIALQNFAVFCQASTWISHRYTYVPSLLKLPPNPTPLGWYRIPLWVSWVIQQVPIGYLFYIR